MDKRPTEAGFATTALAQSGSCDVSDACDELGIPAVRTGALRPLWPECVAVAGRVRTVRLEPAQGASSPLPELLELLAGARGELVLIDLGGRTDCQCWGSVLATAALRSGVRGALVNGCARDVDELRALGFPVYARGVHPAAMRGRLRFVEVDAGVELDGESVEPGSLAVADSSGTVFFPAADVEQVAAAAVALRAREHQQLEAIAAGADPVTILLAADGAEAGAKEKPPR